MSLSREHRDFALVARAQRQDPAAVAEFVRAHGRRMYRTARAILRDDAEAEDAVQQACVYALRSLHRFEGRSRLSTWLVRIVMNEALARRQISTRRAAAMPAAVDPHGEIARAADAGPGPERTAANAQMRRRIEACIDALPDAFRAVFMLVGVEEMSAREVSEALDIPEATVRTRYFRARALLRESLAKEYFSPSMGAARTDPRGSR